MARSKQFIFPPPDGRRLDSVVTLSISFVFKAYFSPYLSYRAHLAECISSYCGKKIGGGRGRGVAFWYHGR